MLRKKNRLFVADGFFFEYVNKITFWQQSNQQGLPQ